MIFPPPRLSMLPERRLFCVLALPLKSMPELWLDAGCLVVVVFAGVVVVGRMLCMNCAVEPKKISITFSSEGKGTSRCIRGHPATNTELTEHEVVNL